MGDLVFGDEVEKGVGSRAEAWEGALVGLEVGDGDGAEEADAVWAQSSSSSSWFTTTAGATDDAEVGAAVD